MNRKQMEQHIRQAARQSTPDVFEKVSSAYVYKTERTEQAMNSTKLWNRKTQIIGGLAAACLMLGVIFGGYGAASYNQVDTTIAIDVNPSVEITANKADKVLSVSPLNDDAVEILGDMNLKRVDLDVAINAIMGSMVKHGYITDVKNSILVTVENDDDTKADTIKTNIVSDINSSLKKNNIKATVFNQKVSADKDLEELAKKYNLSYGKAVFLYQLTLKDPSLTMEQLAPLTLEEIARLISDKKLDISDIVDYEKDESVKDNIEDVMDDLDEEDRCTGCTNGCTCDDCDDDGCDRWCDECPSSCKNAKINKPGNNSAEKRCKFCLTNCTCDECDDDDGCDRWCDECLSSCKNAEINKPGNNSAEKHCKFCLANCTCDECKDDDGCDRWCDECPSSCKNAEVNKPGNGNKPEKGCKFCLADCTCDECKDDDGCDRWCDDCPSSCKNAQVNKPGNNQSSKNNDEKEKGKEKDKGNSQNDHDDD
ncbi:hypothetical protein [Hydrogenoanaerobacterium sp.]|uniref:anti-sigma-I factor RsgI family protein n=1 Tax=Hydrogenoanaerobacterium sp. TaxID=2953763 RepID=UPI00289BA653|nr:hypothetical protein [Hydrogenoanaerobacterium sp.]